MAAKGSGALAFPHPPVAPNGKSPETASALEAHRKRLTMQGCVARGVRVGRAESVGLCEKASERTLQRSPRARGGQRSALSVPTAAMPILKP